MRNRESRNVGTSLVGGLVLLLIALPACAEKTAPNVVRMEVDPLPNATASLVQQLELPASPVSVMVFPDLDTGGTTQLSKRLKMELVNTLGRRGDIEVVENEALDKLADELGKQTSEAWFRNADERLQEIDFKAADILLLGVYYRVGENVRILARAVKVTTRKVERTASANLPAGAVSAAGVVGGGPSSADCANAIHDPRLAKKVSIRECKIIPTETGFPKAIVRVANKTDSTVSLEYRFEWADSVGAPMPSGIANWNPFDIDGFGERAFTSIAPNGKAKTFELEVRGPHPVER